MKDIILTIFFWLGMAALLLAIWLGIKVQIIYAARKDNILKLISRSVGLKWNDFSDEEKRLWNQCILSIIVAIIFFSIVLFTINNSLKANELELLYSSINLFWN